MNALSNFHATGTAVAAVITKVIDDERSGKRRQFAFAECEQGVVFIHLSVVADFVRVHDSMISVRAGDLVDCKYEVTKTGSKEQRRAIKLLSHNEGGVCEGLVSVHPKGFGFIQADPKYGLEKSAFISNKYVEALGLKGGEQVRFTYRVSERGLQALWIETVGGLRSQPVLQFTAASSMSFGGNGPRIGAPAEAKARKAKRAEEERLRRLALKGPNGGGQQRSSNKGKK